MIFVGIVLFLQGFIVAMVGFIWALVQAFSEHVGWGLAYWFIPFAGLVFHIIKWNKLPIRKTFLLQILGFVVGLLGSILFAVSLRATTITTIVAAPKSDISSDVSIETRRPLSAPPPPASSTTSSPSSKPQAETFSQALDHGMGAAVIAQSAASNEDWNLVATEWEKAIALLKAVPQSSSKYALAQKKIVEYQKNLVIAQQKTDFTSENSRP
jgi:hypothetical protein